MGDAEVDQACFFAAGNDFHRVAQNGFGAADKFAAVARFAQGIGADNAHRTFRQADDQLGKATQAVEATLHGLFAQ